MEYLFLFLGVLFATLLIGVPVVFCLFCSAITLMISIDGGITPAMLVRTMINGVNSFSLLAIPFFVFSGELMGTGGISKRIVAFCNSLLGHVKGGLGYVATLASMIFAGISGSALADTTAIGSILLPVMEEEGYDKGKSTALICASGTIGPIIPPSMPMVLYGVAAGVSITKLFLGGIIPGILIGVSLMTNWYLFVRKHAGMQSTRTRASATEVWSTFKDALWALLLIVIMLGGILSGIFTATEAGVIASVYAFVVSKFVYKEMEWKDIIPLLVSSAKTTGKILCICGAATAAAYYLSAAQIPAMLGDFLRSISDNKWVIITLINVLLFLVGCVMDLTPAILILAPLLTSVVTDLGFSPIYFGVIMCMNLCLGLLTPPVGSILYVGCGLSKLNMVKMTKSMASFYVFMFIALCLCTYIPALIMFIPSL